MEQHGNGSAAAGPTRLSIAMCTRNGGRHVAAQLESIRLQTRPPEELVVCDDASTDDTGTILEAFAAGAPFPVRVVHNEPRLGAPANFDKAFGLCTGDWILPCDQDDVWLPQKLATIEQAIRARPGLGLVFSDAEIADEHGTPLGYRFSRVHRLTGRTRRDLDGRRPWLPFLRQLVAQGTALAFAASLRDVILPIPTHVISHDYWIGLIAPALRPVHFIPEPLLLYRQHTAQLTGSTKKSSVRVGITAVNAESQFLRLTARRHAVALERLMASGAEFPDPDIPVHYAEKVAHFFERARIRDAQCMRLPLAAGEVLSGRYFRYSSSWRCIGSDLLARGGA